MSKPVIAARRPVVLDLEPGDYWWCRCGQSQKQPFCDGTHKTTAFAPLKFTLAEAKRVAVCQCKHTEGQPYCDGTHRSLPDGD